MSAMPMKTSWPELVGINGDEAASVIKSDEPSLEVVVLLGGTPVSMDFVFERVRVWVDSDRIVIRVPRVG
ncbi:unnamed protein product [Thlaspi arvense]|uniref:Serine protease inhibitor n=1 Tax=Thlaspi arvense TaxID=13288 RepID=A0AAU9RMG1_THLAR|nr:unnamed protein product [Thlaspi arvense]